MVLMCAVFNCCQLPCIPSLSYLMHNCLHLHHLGQQSYQYVGALSVLSTFQSWLLGALVVIAHIVRIMLVFSLQQREISDDEDY